MLQHFKKSASRIAIGVAFTTIVGCASSRPGGLSDEELLYDTSFPTQGNHTHPHVESEQKIIERAKLAFDDKVWKITQECGDLRQDHRKVGNNLRLAEWEAAKNKKHSGNTRPSKRKRQETRDQRHIDRHETQLTRIATAIREEYNNLKSLDASTLDYKVPPADLKKCSVPQRQRNFGQN